ncbi:M20 aminoacylase family protein [Aquamicrobium zhengzhouense]|jgi:hippurate hydrolase|uniref:Amidohydrolase n=1 Tax=Aquamicrobium zhengzhouense TaxID=2781738 RepID=A0ABS0SJ85_9HYPH|nr:M20 aminoacylase family protein [Aquamicrobium zhengzhouense]MBI1622727.1 amidohydrolase [Aquamicrobium zhengzhouense]
MNAIAKQLDTEAMRQWFEHMHRHPELSMQEQRTAEFIAETLRSFGGYEVETGIGKHGIVATLSAGSGDKTIGLRADFDALPIQEQNNFAYTSTVDGVSHLCGHDGHTAMLLGAAKYLTDTRNFNGTVRLIFQPGEETMEGGPAMIREGLFERFPVDAVFGMHNIPGLEEGKFYFHPGEMMSAVDNWEVEIVGKGGHGGLPELTIDPVVAGSSIVMAIQSIVARNVAPANRAVVTIGAFIAGNAGNVVAGNAILRFSVRTTTQEDREMVLRNIRRIIDHQSQSFGCTSEIRVGVPGAVLVNDRQETEKAVSIAQTAFGEDQVIYPGPSFLASEDFAFMLQKKKGTYCFLGSGPGKMVHHPEYYFNQQIMPIGAAYWVALTEGYLR